MVDHSVPMVRRWRSSSSASPATASRAFPTGFLPIEDQGYLIATGAVARRRLARAHPEGARPGQRDRRKTPGVDAGDHHRRRLARSTTTRRWRTPASPTSSSRTGASAARARTCCRCSRASTRRSAPIEEARHPGAAAAADPGHRQRRRLHHAGASCATAASTWPSCRASTNAIVANAKTQIGHRSGCWRRSAPTCRNMTVEVDRVKTQTLQRLARPGVRRARRLSRLELCRPVQQVRPRLPDLRAGATRSSACGPRTSRTCFRAQQGRAA